jgi:type I restriction enzyme R subunit
MPPAGITEAVVEDAKLDYLRSLGYQTLPGPVIAEDGSAPERSSYEQVVLLGR